MGLVTCNNKARFLAGIFNLKELDTGYTFQELTYLFVSANACGTTEVQLGFFNRERVAGA